MINSLYTIDENLLVTDIVTQDYRTADILQKYGIDYCCNARWPLKTACEMRGIDTGIVKQELEAAIRPLHISNALPFVEWSLDFLADYIIHVHHGYMRKTLVTLNIHLEKFAKEHRKKYAYCDELVNVVKELSRGLPLYMQQEEESIFPYIKQVNRAYQSKESFARLFTRTLRKPVEKVMNAEHQLAIETLRKLRTLTGNYTLPANACRSHTIVFMKLRELDNDLAQHVYLENKVMLPRVLAIESELSQ